MYVLGLFTRNALESAVQEMDAKSSWEGREDLLKNEFQPDQQTTYASLDLCRLSTPNQGVCIEYARFEVGAED